MTKEVDLHMNKCYEIVFVNVVKIFFEIRYYNRQFFCLEILTQYKYCNILTIDCVY